MSTGRPPRKAHLAPGFTLLELVVAMTIVGILSAIAWPSYGAILQRAQRNEARMALLRIQHLQELHYANHLRYASRIGSVPDVDTLATVDSSEHASYALSLRASDDRQRYTAIASVNPAGRQARDRVCVRFTVDESGAHRATDTAGTDTTPICWR